MQDLDTRVRAYRGQGLVHKCVSPLNNGRPGWLAWIHGSRHNQCIHGGSVQGSGHAADQNVSNQSLGSFNW